MGKEFAAYSSVALIESPDSYIVHRRPNKTIGTLAYAGSCNFLGGHRDIIDGQLEIADVAIARELSEETNMGILPLDRFSEYWQGLFEGLDRYGGAVWRHVTCYYLGVSAIEAETMELRERERGELVYIPKNPEIITSLTDQLAPFAHIMLAAFVRGQQPDLKEERI